MTTKAKHTVAAREVAAILHLDAGHDVNGNPRRGYLVVGKAEGWPIAYVDEGYRGEAALADVVRGYEDPKWRGGVLPGGVYAPRKLPHPIHIETKPSELREWRGLIAAAPDLLAEAIRAVQDVEFAIAAIADPTPIGSYDPIRAAQAKLANLSARLHRIISEAAPEVRA